MTKRGVRKAARPAGASDEFRRLLGRFEATFPGFIAVTRGPCSHCMQAILDAWDQSRATNCRFRPAGTLDGDYAPIHDCVVRNDRGRYVYRPPAATAGA